VVNEQHRRWRQVGCGTDHDLPAVYAKLTHAYDNLTDRSSKFRRGHQNGHFSLAGCHSQESRNVRPIRSVLALRTKSGETAQTELQEEQRRKQNGRRYC
jgi:hypothetical protein